MRSNVASLGRLGDDAEIVRRERHDVIRQIEASVRTAWLPVELDISLGHSVFRTCGLAGYLEYCRQAILESTRGPLLGPIRSALMRVGLGPAHALKRLPAGWDLIYRGAGQLVLEGTPKDGRGTMVLRGLPLAMRDNVYLRGIAASLDGVLIVTGGHATRSELTLSGDEAHFELSWSSNDG
ncbi:MAG: hypothetical protein AB8I08_38485 [Sandaracinaceae bacterium]